MTRPRSIWYRKQTGWYYTTINGEKIKLAQTEEAAEVEFHRVMAEKLSKAELPTGANAAKVAFAVIANALLERSKNENARETYMWHRQFLRSFAKHSGKVPFADLTPYHFNRLVEKQKTWNDGGKRGAVVVFKACLNWWAKEHNIPYNPLKHVTAPPDRTREDMLTESEQQQVVDAIRDQPFRDFFFALQ